MKKSRSAIKLIAVLFVMLIVALSLFIAVESGHECHGECCRVCTAINYAVAISTAVAVCFVGAAVFVIASTAVNYAIGHTAKIKRSFSPIRAKVKLSD